MEKQRVTDQHYLAAGKRAIAEEFGTCEMLFIGGKDNLAVASTNAAPSQALIIVAREAVNAARAPRAPAAIMMATATKAEISHARWPVASVVREKVGARRVTVPVDWDYSTGCA